MPQTKPNIRPTGVGTQTVRLRDVDPDALRLAAARLIEQAKDEHEVHRLLQLQLDPGDAGGRIAA